MNDRVPREMYDRARKEATSASNMYRHQEQEISDLKAINAELLAACYDAAERMDRFWGMLDTKRQRAAIANAQPQGE